MTSSLNKRLIGSVIAASALVGTPAFAQEKPRSLVPSFVESQGGQATSKEAPALGSPKTILQQNNLSAPKTDSSEPKKSGGLVVEELGAVHAGTIGLLNSETGGLGDNLWSGASGQVALALVKKISEAPKTPQLVDLYKRLLLSSGAVPDKSEAADQLLDERLKRVISLGLFDEADQLFKRLPVNAWSEAKQELLIQLQLLNGQIKEACEKAAGQKEAGLKSVLLDKTEIVCRIEEGEIDKAELSAVLLEEQGVDDELLYSLVGGLAGDQIEWAAMDAKVAPVHYPLLKKLLEKYPGKLALGAEAAVLKAMASDARAFDGGNADIALALADNSFDIQAQSEIRRAAEAPIVIAEGTDAPKEDAAEGVTLVAADYINDFRLLKAAVTNEEKADVLFALWQKAKESGDFFSITTLTLPDLLSISAGGYSQDFNRAALGILLIHNKTEKAREWERAARRASIQGTPAERLEARDKIARLDLYMLLSGEKGIARWNPASFTNYLKVVQKEPEAAAKANFVLSMMEVFGYSTSEQDWDALLLLDQVHRSYSSNHAYENNLVMSAVQKQVGKTVALSLLAMQSDNPAEISLTTLRAVTSALKAVGLEKEARRLALEVAVLKDI